MVLATDAQANSLILRQAIKIENLDDPVKPVEALLSRVVREEILNLYKIENWTSTENLLGQVARKKGLLKNGGVSNTDEAARAILRDYHNGKIAYFTVPPFTID